MNLFDRLMKIIKDPTPDPELEAQMEAMKNAPHGSIHKLGVFTVRTLNARIACIETFAQMEKKYEITSAEMHQAFAEQKAWVEAGNHSIKPGSFIEKIEKDDRSDWRFHLEMYLGHCGTLEEIPEQIKNSGL